MTAPMAPVLTTKLRRPRVSRELVVRTRLLDRLDLGLDRALTLVSAPAGYGKTTLVVQWLQRAAEHGDVRPAWLSLDDDDNDPARFLAYLLAAFQTVQPDLGQAALAAQDDLPPPTTSAPGPALGTLINEIAALPFLTVLVLDDYHLIHAQPVHDALTFVLEHEPPNLHVVIATRADPPLPIARLRGRGQVNELRQDDLRFTQNEAAEFLTRVTGLQLTAGDIAALAGRAEGWIAGLQMVAASMEGRDAPGVAAFVQEFAGSNRFILDYLLEEVLQRQPEAVQTFLVQTSVLDRLCGLLCDDVIGGAWAELPGAQSQPILEHLERANLFVVPLDDRREWYRYHQLFGDLLRSRLDQEYPGEAPALHRRASAWFERQGLAAEAIDHALAAQDFERAAQLVEQAAEATLARGELATFLRWMDALPPELAASRPALGLLEAWAHLMSGRRLDEVEARLYALGAEDELMRMRAAPLHALLAVFQGQIPRAAELVHRALEQLPQEDFFLRSVALVDLAIVQYAAGNAPAGTQALADAYRTASASGNVMFSVIALTHLAEADMTQGRLHQAEARYRQALALAAGPASQRLPIAGLALLGLGELSREWNRLDEALRLVSEGIELSERWGQMGTMEGYLTLARVRQALGDAEGAEAALQAAQALAARWDPSHLYDAAIQLLAAQQWIMQGKLEQVERWAKEHSLDGAPDLVRPDPADVRAALQFRIRKYEWLVAARLRLAQGRSEDALAILDQVEPLMQERQRPGRVIEVEALKALAWAAQGDHRRALAALQRALTMAEPEGYVRVFVDEGPPMARLLALAIAQGTMPEYAASLVAAIEAEQPAADNRVSAPSLAPAAPSTPLRPAVLVHLPSSPLVEPLSERELDVLRLIAGGLSNREIAERLVLSLPTVKWHTGNIYGKLGVTSRTQAVARARELDILERR